DEATSNLDPGTELVVEQALERLMRDRTVIVVAHRLSTVRRADRIAVIDHGQLTELGSHDELVELGGRYAALAAAWERNQLATPGGCGAVVPTMSRGWSGAVAPTGVSRSAGTRARTR